MKHNRPFLPFVIDVGTLPRKTSGRGCSMCAIVTRQSHFHSSSSKTDSCAICRR